MMYMQSVEFCSLNKDFTDPAALVKASPHLYLGIFLLKLIANTCWELNELLYSGGEFPSIGGTYTLTHPCWNFVQTLISHLI